MLFVMVCVLGGGAGLHRQNAKGCFAYVAKGREEQLI